MSVKVIRGDRLTLRKPCGGQLRHIALAFTVQAGNGAGVSEIEAACVLVDGSKNVVDVVHSARQTSNDGSVRLAGEGRINVDLTRIPPSAQYAVFVLQARAGANGFAGVEKTTVRIQDAEGNDLCLSEFPGGGNHASLVVARLSRYNAEWMFVPVGTPANGRTIDSVLPAIRASF